MTARPMESAMRTVRRPTRLAAAATLTAALLTAPVAPALAAPAVAAPALAASSSPAAARPVAAVAAETADERIRRALGNRVTTAAFGTSFSGTVLDAASNTRVWSRNGTSTKIPASTTKLVTAHNALTVLGPDRRIRTTVRQGSSSDRVIIQAGGDPMLRSSALDRMAATTARTLKARGTRTVRVYVDDDIFPKPSLATGWKASYVPDSVTPVRALVRDQRDVSDTSADVGTYFAARLKAHGIASVRYWGRGNVRSGAATLASSDGWTVAAMVGRMLLTSDNDVAEMLHRVVARAAGYDATWSGARSAQTRTILRAGLSYGAVYDGSGLSRSNRISSLQLATIVDRAVDRSRPELAAMRSTSSLPTAGRTGTLATKYDRFVTSRSRCAAGKVWAKTGTLGDVASLAGYTYGTDGRLKVFAFVVNGRQSTTSLKQNLDMLAATVNGCY
ncbi:D-alanyl-D-alanine carboxypeptidase [Phycicoccus sp. MAQZ13P-2]|uniref:D-alanyl-D-alanine carboxypeptidase/D-alanyl-D-alanine-endopeptidase n=1 Tax=Phycicoccus mangrovi TaxID=2840470 RepID=UPI001C0042D6|nr:D-alanyl-D-alanine carboxypeptidase [Phycicoccus mangrovi]MBT9255414.1 D-alanyl-D-alanine carboxypeptidase [Phycicoccus mangrovi]MBT9273556.1 D-alanyl-D-alanine carboxypeptidase [Phycicoccus mangrovi]